ncbi:serine hydrolase [Bacillus suaedae]|uniref:Serine hydrolase n=1 Tax=Halalkalibacter suaedae TaxID=2822140 RepID=A0A940WUD8_9BACI|nr:serine hydrolase [Bacillus suaedae]MBP3951923.1 serine hydrolase [Bacillus suaedae]
MYLYLWIVFIGFILLTALPLFSKKRRTKWAVGQAVAVTSAIILAIFFIEMVNTPPLPAIIFVVIVSFLADRSTYTKTGLIIVGVILSISAGGAYYLFHDDPEYVENYITNNPDLASIYVSVDGETVVSQEADLKRPLASVVKTIIGIEYANQVANGTIDPEERIPVEELDKFYLANTDGGAHPAWLEEMKAHDKTSNNEVSLHEVAKGMITFSSNANTDFLIEKLGAESINTVIETLELENHDPIYPLVSALLVSEFVKDQHEESLSNDQLTEMIETMPLEKYRETAWKIHDMLYEEEGIYVNESISISMDLQEVWSDNLPNATVEDYRKVMSAISNNTATIPGGEEILRDVMEWPMELHPSNREKYAHFGAKGGSTAFVLNQALYVESNNGKKMELMIFTEGFSFIEQLKMNQNMNSFLNKVLDEHLSE